MRRTILLLSAAIIVATFSAHSAMAGDRYGPPEPVKPVNVSAVEWNGSLLAWTNKGAADTADVGSPVSASPAATARTVQPKVVQPGFSDAASVQSAALPTSLYAPPPAPVADAGVPSGYQPARPTGQVLTLSLADLTPPGPSLERQQAAEEDADALAAKMARADSQAAKDIAAGRPVTGGSSTDLLGGP